MALKFLHGTQRLSSIYNVDTKENIVLMSSLTLSESAILKGNAFQCYGAYYGAVNAQVIDWVLDISGPFGIYLSIDIQTTLGIDFVFYEETQYTGGTQKIITALNRNIIKQPELSIIENPTIGDYGTELISFYTADKKDTAEGNIWFLLNPGLNYCIHVVSQDNQNNISFGVMYLYEIIDSPDPHPPPP